MRTLRIAYISTLRARYVLPYLDFFTRRGHDVHLLSYDRCDSTVPDNVTVHDISLGADARSKRTKWRYPLAAIKARRVLQRIDPDIVHGHYVKSAGTICFLSGYRPYIISARGSDLINSGKSWVWSRAVKQILDASSTVHVVSSQLEKIAKTLGDATNNILVLTQGVDTTKYAFRTPRIHDSSWPVKIICTRTLAAVYDPSTIVEACQRLAISGVPFSMTFAATGPQQAEIQKQVDRCGLSGHVGFLGGYDNANLPKLLAQYDIYVSASKWDGTSVSLLEAMAVGLIPVLSRIDANEEWAENGKTAYFFNAGDVNQLVVALNKAIRQFASWAAMASVNRITIETQADREANMKRMELLYARMALVNA